MDVLPGAMAEDQIHALASRIARLFALTIVPGTVVMVAGAPILLLPFGANYAREGAPVLRVLALGGLFCGVSMLYMPIARVQGRGFRILAVCGMHAALLIVGAVALAKPLRLEGIALSWLGAMAIVDLAILPSLVRFFRSPETAIPAQQQAPPHSPEEVAIPVSRAIPVLVRHSVAEDRGTATAALRCRGHCARRTPTALEHLGRVTWPSRRWFRTPATTDSPSPAGWWSAAWRRHGGVLESAAPGPHSLPQAHLAVFANGVLREELERYSRALGLDQWVRFFDRRPSVRQLRSLDVFLSRSPCEALPIAAPEAMACAVPQVEMNVGGTPEVVSDGETGVLGLPNAAVGLAERILRLLGDAAFELGCQRSRATAIAISSRWNACWTTQPEWSSELSSEGADRCHPASPPLIAQSLRKSLA